MEEQEKDLSRFSRLAAWTEYELADLCLGLTPDRGRADNEARNDVLEAIHRAAEMGELPRKTNSLQPLNLHQYRTSTYYPRSDATRWAAANFPETFPFAAESGGTTGQDEKLRLNAAGGYPVAPEGLQVGGGEDKYLGTAERNTLLKLVIGMAIKGYGYDPQAARSPCAGEIVADLENLGIAITDDTVRKWLKEAATSVLPKKPHQS